MVERRRLLPTSGGGRLYQCMDSCNNIIREYRIWPPSKENPFRSVIETLNGFPTNLSRLISLPSSKERFSLAQELSSGDQKFEELIFKDLDELVEILGHDGFLTDENDGPGIEDILRASGVDSLAAPVDPGLLTAMLKSLAGQTSHLDALAKKVLRELVVERLKKLGIRRPASLVDAAFQVINSKKDEKQGRIVEFKVLEPWGEEVKGEELLEEIIALLKRFIMLPPLASEMIALWILHTYLHEEIDLTPRLAITSPTKRCGKSTLLTVISALVSKPLPAANLTAAVTFRIMELMGPTLLIDEADTFLKENEELRGVLNSGHYRPMAQILRTVGEDHEVRKFSTFGPVAIVLIGELPGTLADRSILVDMQRKGNEPVQKLRRHILAKMTVPMTQKALRWVQDHREVAKREVLIPDSLDSRAADNWSPLLAIADEVGGDWPDRARQAAIRLSADREETDMRFQALRDLESVFKTTGRPWLPTKTILESFLAEEESLWLECSKGRALTAHRLAQLLRNFGIRSVHGSDKKSRGYRLADCQRAFSRYLVDHQASVHPSSQKGGFEASVCPTPDSKTTYDNTDRPVTGRLDLSESESTKEVGRSDASKGGKAENGEEDMEEGFIEDPEEEQK